MAGRQGRKYLKNEELEEGDVWGVMEERESSSPKLKKSMMMMKNSSSAPRMIPKSSSIPNSAPMNIPDWSKIYGKCSKNKKNGTSSSWVFPNNDDGYYGNNDNDDDHDDDDGNDDHDDDDDDGMMPPHEYLAKKLARSQISSFSVCEGIGRTLKGRDLSQVRNAILTKTGFLE